ncbi:MAG: hypothetical protein Q7V46_05395 [Hydrogenophaga sp.]|nr:hypothetical protein [Hydrogenophaga sp.]
MLHTMPIAHPEVRFPVLQLPKLEICFRCGHRLWLRQVNTDPLVREIEHDGGQLTTVDLRRLLPDLSSEVDKAAPIDRAAVIFFNVRLHFRTREAFLDALAAH